MVYDRILDVTAFIDVPVKILTIYIVYHKSSNDQRYYSHFIINCLVWNFLANLIFVLVHFYPAYPAICFHYSGLAKYFTDSENFGYLAFAAIIVCVLNATLSVLYAFPYRYVVFAYPMLANRIVPKYIYCLCAGWHLFACGMVTYICSIFSVSYDDYPLKEELPDKSHVFCFQPLGSMKLFVLSLFLFVMGTAVLILITFCALLYASIHKKEGIVHAHTVQIQHRLLAQLLILTSIPVMLGGVPLIIAIVITCFPHIPYGRFVVMAIIVLLANHGTVYAIALLTMFRPYREAVKALIWRVRGKTTTIDYKRTVAVVTIF